MIDLERTIWIKAPRETVFQFLDCPQHHAEITPSLTQSRKIERLPNGGAKAEFTYKMAGMPLSGTVEAESYEPPAALAFRMDGMLGDTLGFRLEQEGQGTRVAYWARYSIPAAVLERLAEPFVRCYNEREMDATLMTLKDRLESTTQA